MLRQRYMFGELGQELSGNTNLFHGVDKVDGTTLAVYTSNLQRTLQSAWSFLLGFVPLAAVFFAFRSERVFSDTARRAAGIPVYIEDAVRSDDRLFHEWRLDDDYEKWRCKNVRRSKFFLQAASQDKYHKLLNKLFDCSKDERLSPSRSMMDRLIAAKDLDTQVAIEEAHNRPVLVNEQGIVLDPSEREMLQEIGNEVKRRWYAAVVCQKYQPDKFVYFPQGFLRGQQSKSMFSPLAHTCHMLSQISHFRTIAFLTADRTFVD